MTASACARAALGLVLIAACSLPAARPREALDAPVPREAASPTAKLSTPRPRTLRRAEGQVQIALESLAGRGELVVRGTTQGSTALRRDGEGVRVGARLAPSWMLTPASPGTALELDQRVYPGSLRVRPRRDGGLEVHATLELEDYVAGVVAAELSVWSAPPALLEAQAIAARSYAVAELDHRARGGGEAWLYDDTRDQAYRGSPTGAAAARVLAAVQRTRGLVLVEGPCVLDARYHAACGGRTARGSQVFPENDFASLTPVDCAVCAAARGGAQDFTWETTATPAELARLGRLAGLQGALASLEPLELDADGRWLSVRLGSATSSAPLDFDALRAQLGSTRVASALITATWPRPGEPIENGLFLAGRGRGHGVGLCQTGARGLADQGWSAARILAHYYPGASLVDGR